MLGNIGLPTLLFIIVIALLLFGPNKLPELGRALGRTLNEFKKGAKDIMDDEDTNKRPRTEVDGSDVQQASTSDNKNDNRRLPD